MSTLNSTIFKIDASGEAVYFPKLLPPRILKKIIRDPLTGCWVWTGAKAGVPGYPEHAYGRCGGDPPRYKTEIAHKYVYSKLIGPVPNGLELDHSCELKLCVNPAHLQPITHAENIRKRDRKKYRCSKS